MTIRALRIEDCEPDCNLRHTHGRSDIPDVRKIFAAQGFQYQEPQWIRMVCSKVLVDGNDVPRIALLNRPTVETYAVVDPSGWAPPGTKAEEFARLDRAVVADLKAAGYTDQHCWPPPQCRAFMRRLKRYFGWGTSSEWEGLVRYI